MFVVVVVQFFPPLGIKASSLSLFVILLFGSVWSCPECSGAENPETACRANQEPPGTDLLSCSACTCIQCCITDALKWLLGSLRDNAKSKRVYSLSYEEPLSITSVLYSGCAVTKSLLCRVRAIC